MQNATYILPLPPPVGETIPTPPKVASKETFSERITRLARAYGASEKDVRHDLIRIKRFNAKAKKNK